MTSAAGTSAGSRRGGRGPMALRGQRQPARSPVASAAHASTRASHDSHERQARTLATRFVQGEQQLGLGIAAAPASRVALAGSVARPLPLGLRATLESAFDADLSGLRIHADAFAAQAAQAVGARAFASGAHLVFNDGQYRPHSDAGRELIAHEVVHALQQAGRAAAGGRRAVVEVDGTAAPQRDPIPEFDALVQAHAPAGGADRGDYDNVVDTLSHMASKPVSVKKLAQFVRKTTPQLRGLGWPWQAEGLLYDVCKKYWLWDQAAGLLARDNFAGGARIDTVLGNSELTDALERNYGGWAAYTRAIDQVPWIRAYRDAWLVQVEHFAILGNTGSNPPLARSATAPGRDGATIADHVNALLNQLEDPAGVSPNEWLTRAVLLMFDLDLNRRNTFVGITNAAIDRKHSDAHTEDLLRGKAIVDWGNNLHTLVGTFANVIEGRDATAIGRSLAPWLQALGQQVVTIGQKALAVFDGQLSLESAQGKNAVERARLLAELRAAAAPIGVKTGVDAVLGKMLDDLNRSNAKGLRTLTPLEWRVRTAAWLPRLEALRADALRRGRTEAFHKGKALDVRAWIAVDAFVHRVRNQLQYLAFQGDGTDPAPVRNMEDLHYWRLNLAGWLHHVAKPLGWEATDKAGQAVLDASLEPGSIIALRHDDDGTAFRKESLVGELMVEQARRDFGTLPLHGLEPFSLDTLALLYRSIYFEDFATLLRLMLPRDAADEKAQVADPAVVPYLANDAKKALPYEPPQRWTALGIEFAPKKGDKRTFAQILIQHPDFIALRAEQPQSFEAIFPYEPSTKLIVWRIPPTQLLYTTLRGSKTLQGLVAATFDATLAPGERLAREAALDDDAWRTSLQKVFEVRMKDHDFATKQWPAIASELYGRATGQYQKSRKNFNDAFTLAMRRDRQLVARTLDKTFLAYVQDRSTRKLINQAIEQIEDFNKVIGAFEDADRRRQLAILMLEVAPAMEQALKHEDSFSVVYRMLGFTQQGYDAGLSLLMQVTANRDTWLAEHENHDAWIQERMQSLMRTIAHLREVREAEQKLQGFKADAEKKEIVSYVKLSKPLPLYTLLQPRPNGLLGDPSSTAYKVTDILRTFVYHPPYGDAASAFDPNAPSGHAQAQLLEADGKTPLKAGDDEVLMKVTVLGSPTNDDKGHTTWGKTSMIEIRRTDLALLEDVFEGTLWAGFASAMGHIQEGIEFVLNTMLDIAELIPGVGPAIAAVRITTALADFLMSADYEAMLDAIRGGFVDIVKGLLHTLTSSTDAESVFMLLLFGDPNLEALLANSTLGEGSTEAAPASGGNSKFGKLAAIMHAFRRLGGAVFKALRQVDHHVERPMQDIRIAASTGPVLNFLLQFAAAHVYEIMLLASALVDALDKRGKDDGQDAKEIRQLLIGQQASFGKQLETALRALQEFKLPRRVIDIKPAVATVLTFAESFVVARTGFVGKAINIVLKNSGTYDYINGEIAKVLIDAGADPNIWWQTKVLPAVEEQFNSARNAVVEGVNSVFADQFFRDQHIGQIGHIPDMKMAGEEGVKLEAADGPLEVPDTAPLPSDDRPLVPRPTVLPAFGAGTPLSPDLRARFERGTGQDVGHVRLHTGATGDAMTGAFGADALTSGSHVFVRSGRLDATLDHELVHVLQQTGPRPLGTRIDPRPVRGHPERGLDFRPESEAEANDIASMVRAGRPAGRPVHGGAGLQPSFDYLSVARLLRKVSDIDAVVASATSVGGGSAGINLSEGVVTIVNAVTAVLRKPQGNPLWKQEGMFSTIYDKLQARFNAEPYLGEILAGARTTAIEAMEPVSSDAKDGHYLKNVEFADHLQALVLARTGALLEIEFNTTAAGAHKDAVASSNPVKKISVKYIHLPFIDGRSPIWNDVIDNTWPLTLEHDEAFRKRLRRAIRPLLEAEGIRPMLWPLAATKFRFGEEFKLEAIAELKKHEAEKPEAVPWREYVDVKAQSDIGLRLATYQDKNQRGKDRQSHHLTQFLVAEFFANENDTKAFDDNRLYPGVVPEGAQAPRPLGGKHVKLIGQKNGGDDGVQPMATSGDKRGEAMPTISLAAVTHQRGQLHVTPEADEALGGSKTQGGYMRNTFLRQLPSELTAAPQADALTDFVDSGGHDTTRFKSKDAAFERWVDTKGPDTVAAMIHDAVLGTYRAVAKHMSGQLAANMPKLEFDYFTELTAGTPHDIAQDGLTRSPQQIEFEAALRAIPLLAQTHNAAGLKAWGWK